MKKKTAILVIGSIIALSAISYAAMRCNYCKGTGWSSNGHFKCAYCGGKGSIGQ